jgi:hypothetical protein
LPLKEKGCPLWAALLTGLDQTKIQRLRLAIIATRARAGFFMRIIMDAIRMARIIETTVNISIFLIRMVAIKPDLSIVNFNELHLIVYTERNADTIVKINDDNWIKIVRNAQNVQIRGEPFIR